MALPLPLKQPSSSLFLQSYQNWKLKKTAFSQLTPAVFPVFPIVSQPSSEYLLVHQEQKQFLGPEAVVMLDYRLAVEKGL